MTTEHDDIESYLRRLRLALGPLPGEERQEICRELKSHLHDRAGDGEPSLRSTFAELGTPETYARAFLDDYDLTVAIASGNTRRLLAQSYRLAGRSLGAAVGFLVFFTLFAFAVGLVFVAIMKPLFPHLVGVWLSDTGAFFIGFIDPDLVAGSREILGWWFVPLALACALAIWTVASRLLHRFIAAFRKDRHHG